MSKPRIITMGDVVEHLQDDADGGRTFDELRQVRSAIDAAYRQLPGEREWICLRRRGRIVTVAPQTTGTVTYDHTGGTYERQLTLTGATWPDWALEGAVLLNQRRYQLSEVKSTTVATLSPSSNPGADIATPIAYTLLKDTYTLPTDFGAMAGLVDLQSAHAPSYVTDANWLGSQQFQQGPNWPQVFTIMGSPDYQGQKAICFAPAPERERHYEYIYRRQPRPMWIDNYHKGTVTTTAGSAVVQGSTDVDWTRDLEGTVMRFADGTQVPDSSYGERPFQIERVVLSIDVALKQATVDAVLPKVMTDSKYSMSDPVDLELTVMYTPFLRLCEAQQGVLRIWKTGSKEEDRQERRAERRRRMEEYYQALRVAAAMDNPTYDVTSPLDVPGGAMRLRDVSANSGGIGNG